MSTEPSRAEMIIIAVDLRQESRLTASRESTKHGCRTPTLAYDLTKTNETGAVANGNISSNMAVTPAVVGFRTWQQSAAQTASSQVAGRFPVDHSKEPQRGRRMSPEFFGILGKTRVDQTNIFSSHPL
jgi:hypothetical protein